LCTPVILGTQEAEIRRLSFEASPGKQFKRAYLYKALSSNPRPIKKKKKDCTLIRYWLKLLVIDNQVSSLGKVDDAADYLYKECRRRSRI
jgi:hypothetical protein